MRKFYRHWRTNFNEYFFYIYWVGHKGFGRPRLKINYKPNSWSVHVFDFSWRKLHIYLVKCNRVSRL